MANGKHIHSHTTPRFWRHLRVAGIMLGITVLVIGLLGGCIPMGNQRVNADLFENKDDMKQKSAQLAPGMNRQDVLQCLNIPIEKFEQLDTEHIQRALYGNSIVQGSPTELEAFRHQMLAYQGYAIPYRVIESTGTLGFGKINVKREGHDLRMILIFNGDQLVRSVIIGRPNVAEDDDDYFWDNILRTGMSAAL